MTWKNVHVVDLLELSVCLSVCPKYLSQSTRLVMFDSICHKVQYKDVASAIQKRTLGRPFGTFWDHCKQQQGLGGGGYKLFEWN
jgi:hypothetical protein